MAARTSPEERERALAKLGALLGKRDMSLLYMRFVDRLSLRRVAEVLGLSEREARARLKRALVAIRGALPRGDSRPRGNGGRQGVREHQTKAGLASSRAEALAATGQAPEIGKLESELRAFAAMKPGALAEYGGHFVAVHRGKVIDSDPDDLRLAARIEKRAVREGAITVCWVGGEGDAEAASPDDMDFAFESPLEDDLDR